MELIKEFKGQELKVKLEFLRIFASILISLSGLLLYLDKVLSFLDIVGSDTHGFSNYSNFIWAFTQSIAPVIMIMAFQLKPYILSFLIPIYCYTIQIIWVFDPSMYFDDILLHIYAVGSCSIFVLLFFFIKNISNWRNRQQELKEEFQQETEEILHILKAKTLSKN